MPVINNFPASVSKEPPKAPSDAVVLYSLHPFSLKTNNGLKNWNGTLYYIGIYESAASNWNTWDGTTTISAELNNGYYTLYLRGDSNSYLTTGRSNDCVNAYWVFQGVQITCKGNLSNLLRYTTTPTVQSYCFAYLFYNASQVYFDIVLPTSVSRYCYLYTFAGCTGLVKAPDLPMTTLNNACYKNMFYGCTNLTAAPSLPATNLRQECYYSMFVDCKSLATLPALGATTLSTQCYGYMFYGCDNIRLSTTSTSEYSNKYRIPTIGDGTTASNAMVEMFTGTGGTFTGTPSINIEYYTSNIVVS